MLIKFKSPDPRAGTVAQMDSYRGQQLIDIGAATQLKENGSEPAVDLVVVDEIVHTPQPIKTLPKKNNELKNKAAV